MIENITIEKYREKRVIKKAFIPVILQGQKLLTSAVPPGLMYIIHPLILHTIICTPLITEGVPVSSYSQLISGFPHKSIQNYLCNRIPTNNGSLYTNNKTYFSCSSVLDINGIISMDIYVCQYFFIKYFNYSN